MSVVGANVRALRRARGLKQEQLAEQARISKSYLCHIEKGRRKATEKVLGDLATALEVEPDVLAGDPLSTWTAGWRIETEQKGRWVRYDPPGETQGLGSARAMLVTLRAAYPEYQWRAVRIETTETLEVW